MPQRLAKTKKHRALKTKKMGATSKSRRENHGTTARFPLTGAIPSIARGVSIDAKAIAMPAAKAAKAAAPAKAKTAAKSAQ